MQTPEFEAALDRAIDLARQKPAALMCAEAVPWRCHRSLVSDALVVRGFEVREIVSAVTPRRAQAQPFARVQGRQITYPKNADDAQMSLLKEPAR